MKRALFGLVIALVGTYVAATPVYAAGLKLAPLEYRTTLSSGEKQKGFVDVSNPTKETLRVTVSTQAFRQTDDTGSLEFFDDEQVSSGILLDLDEFDLGPREAIRMYFVLDSTRLPTGDVYGAIFMTTTSAKSQVSNVGQSVRLGTLLSIVNGTPGERSAELQSLNVPFLQIGDTVKGSYSIKNTGNSDKATGFYPVVNLKLWPLGKEQAQKGKLVFADRTRQNDFETPAPLIGFYKVTASYGASEKAGWVFVVRPFILLICGALVVILAFLLATLRYRKRSHRYRSL